LASVTVYSLAVRPDYNTPPAVFPIIPRFPV